MCKILAIFKLQKFFNLGSKKFSLGGPTPKPEVKLLEVGGAICRAWRVVSHSEKFFEKFPRVTKIFGVKENFWRHLAAKLELFGWKWNREWVEGIEAYNV